MIYSMTGFARQESDSEEGCIVWELRTVNHRYLEVNLRLPETFTQLEGDLRERIRASLQRGKLDCTLRYQVAPKNIQLVQLNQKPLQGLLQACQVVAQYWPQATTIDPLALLQWPGIMQTVKTESQHSVILTTFEQALQALMLARAQEGSALQNILEQKLQAIQLEVAAVRTHLPAILDRQRQRLINRFQEIKIDLDPLRLEQEMVMFAQRMDIAEELERLDMHILEVQRLLNQGAGIGRRLDFLMQELQREANTLGSKLVDVKITRIVVELKVLIEQMREQIQNIE